MIALVDRSSGGMPMYYTLNSVHNTSGGEAWTSDQDKALLFGRERDAKEFISKYLLYAIGTIELETVNG